MSEEKDEETDDDYEDECEHDEGGEEWKEYKESMKEWKDQYKEILHDWKNRIKDWKNQIEEGAVSGSAFHFDFPPLPPVPPIPPMHSTSTGRANVVASRIGDEDIRLIDMLIEAGVFSTRSEAVAYLVNEGIKARRDTFEKVSSSLEEIRKTRKEAERQVENLKEEIGLKESKMTKGTAERHRNCPKCGKQMPEEHCSFCPSCGSPLEKK